uniref:YMGG-like Gly-zipper domain-containing protein n=1 Tax=Desulfobacca acetoxidans TaxID=60893 RepID=A0A7C3UXA5_9BACT
MLWVILLAGAITLVGCATPQNPYTYQGAGLGAAVGAAIGAGTNAKNPWKGAAIGGLLGGAAGAVAGEIYGRENPYPSQPGYYQPGPQPGYGYPPNPNYNRSPYYGTYGQAAPSYPPGYYSQEGAPAPYGASQRTADPYYRYAY